ncbi:SLAM family member 5-like [Varanus komodoensis]|uniref:SLAM family member 5-like n=1 Tax=Varanus komodoensis TaxID=61221 RepID=UPI001CF79B8D|nr:SLAM family member 5-like [Varanus komodoensis]
MSWLLAAALLPLLALQAEKPKFPSRDGNGAKGVFNDTTLQERETEQFRDAKDRSSTTEGGQTARTTSLPSTIKMEHSGWRLPKPTITVRSTKGTCDVTLSCAVAGAAGPVSYAWSSANASMVLPRGPTLHVRQKPPDGSLEYTCTASSKESENSSTVSLREHCHEPPSLGHEVGLTFYLKYVVPPLVVVLLLLGLLCMYRRKRGGGSHNSIESINESSDSDDADDNPAVLDQLASPTQGLTSIPETSLETMETCPIEEDPVVSDQPPSQA